MTLATTTASATNDINDNDSSDNDSFNDSNISDNEIDINYNLNCVCERKTGCGYRNNCGWSGKKTTRDYLSTIYLGIMDCDIQIQ